MFLFASARAHTHSPRDARAKTKRAHLLSRHTPHRLCPVKYGVYGFRVTLKEGPGVSLCCVEAEMRPLCPRSDLCCVVKSAELY